MKFKVTFHLDGAGVHFNPNEPIHLDALLTWALAPRQGVKRNLQRDDVPEHVAIPLLRANIGDAWVWKASALLPQGDIFEGLQFWRKRFRESRADLSTGSLNLRNSTYRDWNMPMPLLLCRTFVAYAEGSRKECKRVLKEVRYLGKKRAYGLGRITNMEFDEMNEDWSLARDGLAMRWLPHPEGARLVRVRPPYWNAKGRVRCCEIGDPFDLTWLHKYNMF